MSNLRSRRSVCSVLLACCGPLWTAALRAQDPEPTATPKPAPGESRQPQEPQKPPGQAPAQAPSKQDALDQALADLAEEPGAAPTQPALAQAGPFRLIDISLDGLFAVGTSTEQDPEIQDLEGGGHDPRKRGFTVQNVELSLLGAVDPYFTAEAHIVAFVDPIEGEPVFELEEAFFTTTSLPYGLEIEGGVMLTEFGRLNPMHPHAWDWLDQPVILTRLLGPDGMRGVGARLGWLTPLPWFAQVDVTTQNANGETMASFLANQEFFDERPIGGRVWTQQDVASLADLVYTARLLNSWDLSDETTLNFGMSAAFGPNATGEGARTAIYGTDVLVKWQPAHRFHGAPSLTLQGEFLYRDYEAAAFSDQGTSFGSDTLTDYGFYAQAIHGFEPRWQAGLRYELVTGSGDDYDQATNSLVSRETDPFRDDRYRISPLVMWRLSENSRLRLQYNYDAADHLADGHANSIWLGIEVSIGAHPAHKY